MLPSKGRFVLKLPAAADGWSEDFAERVASHRGAIRAHCYRMLGSSHDSDDLLQETLLRAFRSRETLRDPGRERSWLLRIATNACLDELQRRPRRVVPADLGAPSTSAGGLESVDEPWQEPMPDAWLEDDDPAYPGARLSQRESITLAFVAALQRLSPVQRACLLLRDVLGFSAMETAEVLRTGVGAANSALFRARSVVEDTLGECEPSSFAVTAAEVDPELLARYVRAYEASDLDALLSTLRDDVRTSMPPSPTWIAGRAANAGFYRAMFSAVPPGAIHLLPIGANGQPAFGFYRAGTAGAPRTLRAIHVIGLRNGAVATIDHFMMPGLATAFGLPLAVPG